MPQARQVGPQERERLLRLATLASVTTASLLIIGKLGAWLVTGSVTVLASLVDSMMDAVASVVTFVAVRFSLQPADDEHRFGHGKAEPLAGLGQATFIAGSAVFLLLETLDRFLHPQPLQSVGTGVGVMSFSIVATLLLLALQRHVIRRTGSTAIQADALHYATDLITNLTTILALGLAHIGWTYADPVLAVGIAAYILKSAYHIAREAVALLMDREIEEEVKQRILEIAYRPPAVRGVHDMRSRQSGHAYFVQLHLELDDSMPLYQAHEVAEEVELGIRAAFPNAEIIIHQDPVGTVVRERVVTEPRPDG